MGSRETLEPATGMVALPICRALSSRGGHGWMGNGRKEDPNVEHRTSNAERRRSADLNLGWTPMGTDVERRRGTQHGEGFA